LETDKKETLKDVIHKEIVFKQYGAGVDVFPGSARMEFWHELAVRIAKKATEKATVAEPEISDNTGAEISDDTGEEIRGVLTRSQ